MFMIAFSRHHFTTSFSRHHFHDIRHNLLLFHSAFRRRFFLFPLFGILGPALRHIRQQRFNDISQVMSMD